MFNPFRSSAMDSVREGAVAIKYIPDVFSNLSDARRILREVRVTQRLTHINVSKFFKKSRAISFKTLGVAVADQARPFAGPS